MFVVGARLIELATPDERHDFQPIAVLQLMLLVQRAGHDLLVHFDRHPTLRHLEIRQQLRDRQRAGQLLSLSIEHDIHEQLDRQK